METLGNPSNGGGSKWQGPEKMVGLLLLAAIGGVGVYFWGSILPWLNDMLENSLKFAGLSVVVAIIIAAVTSKKLRTSVNFLFKMMLRKIAGVIVETDPIAILEIGIDESREEHRAIDTQINKVAAEDGKITKTISDTAAQMKEKFSEANQAIKMGKQQAAELATFEAGAMKDVIDRLTPLQTTLRNILAFLNKVYSAGDFQIKKMDITVKMKKIEYEAVKSSYSAMGSAMRLLKGDPDKAFMLEQATNFIADDIGKKLGEMKRAMEMSTEILDSIDIQKGVCSEKGLKMLEEFNNGNMSLMAGVPGVSSSPMNITSMQKDNRVPVTHNNLLD